MKPKAKPGSAKGVPKPLKRTLDPDFGQRLKAAMAQRAELSVQSLADKVGCTKQALYNYLRGTSKQIEALLLFDLADELDVSTRWLLLNEGPPGKGQQLTPDQLRVLNLAGLLNEAQRDLWISQGEEIRKRTPHLVASVADPYANANGTAHSQ